MLANSLRLAEQNSVVAGGSARCTLLTVYDPLYVNGFKAGEVFKYRQVYADHAVWLIAMEGVFHFEIGVRVVMVVVMAMSVTVSVVMIVTVSVVMIVAVPMIAFRAMAVVAHGGQLLGIHMQVFQFTSTGTSQLYNIIGILQQCQGPLKLGAVCIGGWQVFKANHVDRRAVQFNHKVFAVLRYG